uniref:Uncharacterized protein n=1 Tax=Sus scrofa TaxID=9823 RepID=A0A480GQZ8_PIG
MFPFLIALFFFSKFPLGPFCTSISCLVKFTLKSLRCLMPSSTNSIVIIICVCFSSRFGSRVSLFFLHRLRATPEAYGGSQPRGLIGATATSLRHSRSSAGSELRLQPTPQLTAMPDP